MARREAAPGDVERLVQNIVADYEKVGDAVVRLLALEPRHPSLSVFLDVGRASHRGWVETKFADVLAAADAARREQIVDALTIVTDVYAWKLLRRDKGRGVGATAAAMTSMVRAVIAEGSKDS
jgi:hypothetical protein